MKGWKIICFNVRSANNELNFKNEFQKCVSPKETEKFTTNETIFMTFPTYKHKKFLHYVAKNCLITTSGNQYSFTYSKSE